MKDLDTDREAVLARFNRLIQELLRGETKRHSFRQWEIELLLDIEECDLRNVNRRELLRRYQRAVQKQLEAGATRPMKLSEYLAQRRRGSRRRSAEPGGLPAAANDEAPGA